MGSFALSRVPDEPDFGEPVAKIGPDPDDLAWAQSRRAVEWMQTIRSGTGARWFLPSLHRLTGRLLPGWTVFIGGYSKTAKTTLLQTQARCWAEAGVPVAYIGTETTPELLRLQSAAITLGLPVELVIGDQPLTEQQHARITADLERQQAMSSQLMYAETHETTLTEVLFWLNWGADRGAKVVMFDHIHRLDAPGQDRFGSLTDAVRALNSAAQAAGILLLCAAQFRENKGDSLGNHELPSDGQWYGSSAFQQEGVVNLQLWRPFRVGVSPDDKQSYKRGDMPLSRLLAPETLGVRCSAHRYRPSAYGESLRLKIVDDQITDFDAVPDQPERYR